MALATMHTIADLVETLARERGDDLALTFVDHAAPNAESVEHRTYAQLWAAATRLAAGLSRQGFHQGERAAILMANHPEFVEMLIASGIIGLTLVPMDPRTPPERLAYMLTKTRCSLLVAEPQALQSALAVRDACPDLRLITVLDDPSLAPAEGVAPFSSLQAATVSSELAALRRPADEDMQILFTSGTTGNPKGIAYSHRKFTDTARMAAMAFGYGPGDTLYSGLSLTHANAQLVTLGAALVRGLPVVFSRRFSKRRMWSTVREHRCTSLTLLGGMTTAIYCDPPTPADRDHQVRLVVSAGMPAAIWNDFEHRFGVSLLEFYGTAEGGLTMKPPGVGPIGSIGKPPPALSTRIVDDAGQDVAPGERGQLLIRSSDGTPFQVSYVDDPEASEAKCRGGWLWTGDVVHADANGWLFFDFRMGHGIRRNGDFIDAASIEKTLAETALVDDVFVFGVPAASRVPGESDVVAAVVFKQASAVNGKHAVAALHAALTRPVVLQQVLPLDAIPKTASEKPLARVLSQILTDRPDLAFGWPPSTSMTSPTTR
ncbi:AMP-binding protein [Hydrogenophaga sp. 2FB]|uniref:class I adenylate-forming enzyme family protein n=1 Tax=Hydrogenophaga sp. 2FB TaxID=2502187 RepID=UPI0010F60B24|nr:AMP-binding protein [Hydrogenophaga sp. 2FB]